MEIGGALDSSWLESFPEAAVNDVIAYVVRNWMELSRLHPHSHTARELEPVLTKSLADFLDEPIRRRASGIGGRFHAERPVNVRRNGRLKVVGRTDIEYHYPRPGNATLTVECKKLDGTYASRTAYRNKGMRKFLVGTYARHEKLGVMCGLVTSNVANETEAMRASIERCRRQLACVTNAEGDYVSRARAIEAGAMRFETLHQKATTDDSLQLSHVFVSLASRDTPDQVTLPRT